MNAIPSGGVGRCVGRVSFQNLTKWATGSSVFISTSTDGLSGAAYIQLVTSMGDEAVQIVLAVTELNSSLQIAAVRPLSLTSDTKSDHDSCDDPSNDATCKSHLENVIEFQSAEWS